MRDVEGLQLRPDECQLPVGLFHRIPPPQKMPEKLGQGLGIAPVQQRVSHRPDRQVEMNGETDKGKGNDKDHLLDAADQSPIHGEDKKGE